MSDAACTTGATREPDLTPAPLEAAGVVDERPDDGYVYPDDPLVRANLESWRDLKLGVIMHWGIYSYVQQGGSWSLHRESLGWFTDQPPWFEGSDAEYHSWYYQQAADFTGPDFEASDWISACRDAGMRYCVFTAKHHDGFCMYDSQFTNLKSTSEASGLRRDVLREVVDACRAHDLEVGLYFSKADWSQVGYWDRSLPITDRFHNYDIARRPVAWDRFVQFTHDQVEELLRNYGPTKVLWLDAGWVCAPHEPMRIDELAAKAREIEPGILVVDRGVHGPHENYRTPEQEIPDAVIDHPWEACITLTKEWCAMAPDDPAKPCAEVVANLVRIVARGGNYLIGIGPDATGHMPPSVRSVLAEVGQWMRACGEGIYGTRVPRRPVTVSGGEGVEWHVVQRGDDLYVFGLGVEPGRPVGTVRVGTSAASARMLGGPEVPVTPDAAGIELKLPESPTSYAVGVHLVGAARGVVTA